MLRQEEKRRESKYCLNLLVYNLFKIPKLLCVLKIYLTLPIKNQNERIKRKAHPKDYKNYTKHD